MSVSQVDFAEPFFSIDYVENEAEYRVTKKSMVINLAEKEQRSIVLSGERVILPLKAAVVQDMVVTDLVRAFIVKDFERCDLDDAKTVEAIKKSWKLLYECSGIERHKGLPYYKSPKLYIGEGSGHLELNFCYVDKGGIPSGPHRDHDRDFDEVHAQIRGYGMMRVYERDDNVHIHQELNMAPGTVHDKMYDSKGQYPWHEYKSVTPGVYCPIEIDR